MWDSLAKKTLSKLQIFPQSSFMVCNLTPLLQSFYFWINQKPVTFFFPARWPHTQSCFFLWLRALLWMATTSLVAEINNKKHSKDDVKKKKTDRNRTVKRCPLWASRKTLSHFLQTWMIKEQEEKALHDPTANLTDMSLLPFP